MEAGVRKGLWIGGILAAAHFTMLSLGMLRIDFPAGTPLAFQRGYARVTGAGGSFGFFSPNVPREFDLKFDLEQGGKQNTVQLEDHLPSEVRARVTNMVNLLATHFHNEKIFRSLAASFTAAMFREYPEAHSIRLQVLFNDFPSVGEFRGGRRSELKKLYSAKFTRRASL